jgi:hypothetical protein
MPVGFEPTIAVLERAKTVRALDRSVKKVYSIRSANQATSQLVEATVRKDCPL